MDIRYLILAILWIAWCLIHSGMISLTVTTRLRLFMGNYYRLYRLIYNALAVATIMPIILFERLLGGEALLPWSAPLMAFRVFLALLALKLFIDGAKHYDLAQFLGIRQIRSGVAHNLINEKGALDIRGIFLVVRHPWYLGAILLIWVRALDTATLVANLILTIYLIAGTHLEERKLLLEYGEEYRSYQEKVSMLIPFKYMASIIRK